MPENSPNLSENPFKIKLYSYFRSSSAYRIRIALNLKNLAFEYIPVHLLKNGGEQFLENHKSLNPSSQVPVLKVDDYILNQSMAILFYLDEIAPNIPLFSKDPFVKSKMVEACEIINSGIQPIQNLSVLTKLKEDFDINEEQKINWVKYWIERGFEALEKTLSPYAESFSFQNEVSACDVYLVPQVYNALRFKVDMKKFPKLLEIYENCEKLEAFNKAHPQNQPDTPEDL